MRTVLLPVELWRRVCAWALWNMETQRTSTSTLFCPTGSFDLWPATNRQRRPGELKPWCSSCLWVGWWTWTPPFPPPSLLSPASSGAPPSAFTQRQITCRRTNVITSSIRSLIAWNQAEHSTCETDIWPIRCFCCGMAFRVPAGVPGHVWLLHRSLGPLTECMSAFPQVWSLLALYCSLCASGRLWYTHAPVCASYCPTRLCGQLYRPLLAWQHWTAAEGLYIFHVDKKFLGQHIFNNKTKSWLSHSADVEKH